MMEFVNDHSQHGPNPGKSAEPARAWVTGHDVQFYATDDFLASTVGAYLVEGVRAGQPLVVLATRAHRDAFRAAMRARGIEPDDLVMYRDAVWLDAHDSLDAFMEGGKADPELFEATVGSVFARLIATRKYLVVRAYGELVDVLWRQGNTEAAIAVEKMWNALASKYSFSLLCAYSRASLLVGSHPRDVERICDEHSRVLPSEFRI